MCSNCSECCESPRGSDRSVKDHSESISVLTDNQDDFGSCSGVLSLSSGVMVLTDTRQIAVIASVPGLPLHRDLIAVVAVHWEKNSSRRERERDKLEVLMFLVMFHLNCVPL